MELPLFADAATEPPPPAVPAGAPAFGADTAQVLDWLAVTADLATTVATTSFGMEGCALLHRMHADGRFAGLRVVTIDTGFHFRETRDLAEKLRRALPDFAWERAATDLTPARQAVVYGERLWDRKPDLCCALRKVEPLRRVLAGASTWVTALRRGPSAARQHLQPVSVDPGQGAGGVWKVSPLAAWSRPDVWAYVNEHGVPYNPLHEQGYPSVGCTHCTKPVEGARPADDTRAGRWSGKQKTECGLHYNI